MKKVFTSFILILFFAQISYSQQVLESGAITMEIVDIDSDDEMLKGQLGMLKGSETKIYFKDKQSRVESNLLGGLVLLNVISDHKENVSNMYVDMMGNKILVSGSLDEMREAQQDELNNPNVKVVETGETKTILGYECTKYVVQVDGQEETGLECYATKEIAASKELVQGFEYIEFDGFPLEYKMDVEGMKMTISTTKIETNIDKSSFKIDPTGYRKMTMEEFAKEMGGMAGGLGF